MTLVRRLHPHRFCVEGIGGGIEKSSELASPPPVGSIYSPAFPSLDRDSGETLIPARP